MWILPKQISSTISPSVRGTKGLETGSDVFCQMCEKSLMWRSKPSLSRTWLTRLKRGGFIKHLFTRTLNPSLIESFEGWWTSSVAVFPASRFLKLELEKLRKTQDTCSLSSPKESKSANLELFSSKMLKESSAVKPQMENQFSNMSSEHWKKWVTEQRQEYLARAKSVRRIKEKESSSLGWPTASVAGCVEGGVAKNVQMDKKGTFYRYNKQGVKWSVKLRDAVIHHEKNWATPNTMDHLQAGISGSYKESLEGRRARSSNLRDQVNFPTPTSRDWKDTLATVPPSRSKPTKQTLGQRIAHVGLQDQTKNNTNGKNPVSLKLNPNWVEQLMGLPVGWTDLDFSEME